MNHTKSIGIIPFDQPFTAGFNTGSFKGREECFSPIARTNRLRRDFLNKEFSIDSQRAVLITEAYKKFTNEPIILKRAKSLQYLLENLDIHIYEDELIPGNHGAPNNASAVYPEFSLAWLIDEMENFPFEERTTDVYLISEDAKNDLRSIADYWKNNTVDDTIKNTLSFDEAKGSNNGISLFLLNLYQYGGIGHHCGNYEKLINIGFTGYKELIQSKLDNLKRNDKDYIEKRSTLEAMLITVEGSITYIKRYQKAYEEKAKNETDARLKAEYTQLAKNLDNISKGAAKNIWEAMMLIQMATSILLIESNGHSISHGRIDQYLYPFYKRDIENGTFTKEFVQELLESHLIKIGTPAKVRDRMTIIANAGRAFGGESNTVGGVDVNGNDATNDLSFMYMDYLGHTRMMAPWTSVRISKKTPIEFKRKVVEVIKTGCGHPKVFNDEVAIESQLKIGRTLEEAREYGIVGCVEINTPAKEFGWHDSAYFNSAKTFELAINNGRCLNCSDACPRYSICAGVGKRIGLETGHLADFENIEQVKEAFKIQHKYFIDLMCSSVNVMEYVHRELAPVPFTSILFDDCIENGKELMNGGAKYNHHGPQSSGIGTIADSLVTIDQLMFKQKVATGEQLMQAIKDNWEGHEKLYRLVNSSKLPHYGNDDDYADAFASFVFDHYCDCCTENSSIRGGIVKPGVYGVSVNVAFGFTQAGATLDGRKMNEPISDNLGAVHTLAGSHDVNGPTALANSVAKLDHSKATNGTLLNWKFTPETVSGETGAMNFIKLMDTFFEKGGFHSQYNVMNSSTMKAAMEKPDQYRDMLVRVAGYSAYFVDLSQPLQLDLIGRTELSFE